MRHRGVLFPLLVVLALVVSYLAGCATGSGQPHMSAALDHLHSAHSELELATADKGGHRVRAIELVDSAIREVDAGMNYARSH